MELGSEYDLNLNSLNKEKNNFFHYFHKQKYVLFNSGRSAIKFLNIQEGFVLLPEFICESVTNCFKPEQIVFYKINEDFSIDFNDLLNKVCSKTSVVFLVHYFGKYNELKNLKNTIKSINTNIKIIEDLTQSLFSWTKTTEEYVIASIRKWFPIPNGGILIRQHDQNWNYTNIPRCKENTKAYAMILKNLYLNDNLDCNKEYRTIFSGCEQRLDTNGNIEKISNLSEYILECQNIINIIKSRKENFRYLKSKLEPLGLRSAIELNLSDCPFNYPIRVPNRDKLRNYLIENNIFCAVHWPFDNFKSSERNMGLRNSKELLSLPIDQRYTTKELDYLIEILSKYRGELSF